MTPECPKGVFRSGGKLFEIIKLVFYIFLLKSTKIDRLKYTKHVITTQFTSRGGILGFLSRVPKSLKLNWLKWHYKKYPTQVGYF